MLVNTECGIEFLGFSDILIESVDVYPSLIRCTLKEPSLFGPTVQSLHIVDRKLIWRVADTVTYSTISIIGTLRDSSTIYRIDDAARTNDSGNPPSMCDIRLEFPSSWRRWVQDSS